MESIENITAQKTLICKKVSDYGAFKLRIHFSSIPAYRLSKRITSSLLMLQSHIKLLDASSAFYHLPCILYTSIHEQMKLNLKYKYFNKKVMNFFNAFDRTWNFLYNCKFLAFVIGWLITNLRNVYFIIEDGNGFFTT